MAKIPRIPKAIASKLKGVVDAPLYDDVIHPVTSGVTSPERAIPSPMGNPGFGKHTVPVEPKEAPFVGPVAPSQSYLDRRAKVLSNSFVGPRLPVSGNVKPMNSVPLDGNVFNQSANTWGGLFKSGLNGMTNAVFKGNYGNWGGALRYAAPAAFMGAAGGVLGFAGSKIWPEYMSYEGAGQAVMKGAMAGIGLGLARKGLGSMTTKIGAIDHLKHLQSPLSKVNKVAQSSVTMGALAAGNFMSGFESHLTRPLNGIESV